MVFASLPCGSPAATRASPSVADGAGADSMIPYPLMTRNRDQIASVRWRLPAEWVSPVIVGFA